jgi:hypothetical protein
VERDVGIHRVANALADVGQHQLGRRLRVRVVESGEQTVLPPLEFLNDEADLLTLTQLKGCTLHEIATDTGVPYNTLRQRHLRARNRLRGFLKAEGGSVEKGVDATGDQPDSSR